MQHFVLCLKAIINGEKRTSSNVITCWYCWIYCQVNEILLKMTMPTSCSAKKSPSLINVWRTVCTYVLDAGLGSDFLKTSEEVRGFFLFLLVWHLLRLTSIASNSIFIWLGSSWVAKLESQIRRRRVISIDVYLCYRRGLYHTVCNWKEFVACNALLEERENKKYTRLLIWLSNKSNKLANIAYSIMNMIRAISRRRGMVPPSYSLLFLSLLYSTLKLLTPRDSISILEKAGESTFENSFGQGSHLRRAYSSYRNIS